jgi:citrate lyase beta subunit
MRLSPDVYAELDDRLEPVDAELRRRYPGEEAGRQPVHTVYLPADRYHAGVVDEWGSQALAALRVDATPPFPAELADRVVAKLIREPIEDLRIDFEDGYGVRDDSTEDSAARAAARSLPPTPFSGIRVKSLDDPVRRRAVRTLDVFLDALSDPLPDGFVVTLPKVSDVAQVVAMAVLCGHLEQAYGLPGGRLRFELQVETPAAVLGPDGTVTLARMVHAAEGRCVGLHYGTYDYSAACGIAGPYQSLDHPAADHAKAVMQVATAGTGIRLSDGATNVLPVGDSASVRAAWTLHYGLVRRSLERGFYQGWDLHPAQLPTRYGATYGFFREGLVPALDRLRLFLDRRSGAVLDEPATARALARFLLRGLDCGALDEPEVGFGRSILEQL